MHALRFIALTSAALALGTPHLAMAQATENLGGLTVENCASAVELDAAVHVGLDLGVAVSAPSPFEASAIDDGALRRIAGREDVAQLSYAEQVAGVSKNSVGDNSTTGNAQISDNALQNLSGLSILNVNTGNNVAINAAMNVNISFNAQP